jgi:hypothetical protein
LYLCMRSSIGQTNNNLKKTIMYLKLKTGANWLQRVGTFCVKSSRDVTMCLTISQKGGLLL